MGKDSAKPAGDQSLAEEHMLRFRAAMDVSADLVLLIDPAELRYVDANEAAVRALGYSREELLAMGPLDIFSATREALIGAYARLIAGDLSGTAATGVYRCKDGSMLAVESLRRAVRSASGLVIVSVARDIRQRLLDEEALRASEARYRSTIAALRSELTKSGPPAESSTPTLERLCVRHSTTLMIVFARRPPTQRASGATRPRFPLCSRS